MRKWETELKDLTEIVERSGNSLVTVLKWLGRLESEGLITRKPLIEGRDAQNSFTIQL